MQCSFLISGQFRRQWRLRRRVKRPDELGFLRLKTSLARIPAIPRNLLLNLLRERLHEVARHQVEGQFARYKVVQRVLSDFKFRFGVGLLLHHVGHAGHVSRAGAKLHHPVHKVCALHLQALHRLIE